MGSLSDEEFDEWVSQQRARVEEYLTRHGITDPHVGPWPAFEMAPWFAVWAVESQKVAGKIGWWAFSGDCPTDYISEDGQCHPRSALRRQLECWRTYVPFLKRGQQPPGIDFGREDRLAELGELLEKRVGLLDEWVADDELWEDR
jgi:hypothetical protein